MENKKSGLATAGFVLGIIGIATSFIPIINNASFVLGVLATIFGIIALIKKNGSKGKTITAIILGILTIVFVINLQQMWTESLNELGNEITGGSTEEILRNDVDVTLGEFQVIDNEYFDETKMVVTVKNKNSETKSYSIHIEAVDSQGTRLADDYVMANNLSPNQTQNFDIFLFVSSEKIDSLKSATFKIVEVSKF